MQIDSTTLITFQKYKTVFYPHTRTCLVNYNMLKTQATQLANKDKRGSSVKKTLTIQLEK